MEVKQLQSTPRSIWSPAHSDRVLRLNVPKGRRPKKKDWPKENKQFHQNKTKKSIYNSANILLINQCLFQSEKNKIK